MSSHIVPFCPREHRELFNDEHILVVSKPHGLLSVPGRLPENHDSLISRVQQKCPEALIVHRLDCETSGVMVLAKHPESHKLLSQSFANREVEKHYIAEVDGLLETSSGSVDLPLICDWPNRPRQKVCQQTGKASLTNFERLSLDTQANTSRVKLTPHTGRSHQLRLHMAAIGHAIIGDEFYASKAAFAKAERMLLHAEGLSFRHPFSQENLSFFDAADF